MVVILNYFCRDKKNETWNSSVKKAILVSCIIHLAMFSLDKSQQYKALWHET